MKAAADVLKACQMRCKHQAGCHTEFPLQPGCSLKGRHRKHCGEHELA